MDNKENDRFAYLFGKYIEKRCTPAEKEELLALLHAGAHDETLRRLIDTTWEQEIPIRYQDDNTARRILAEIFRHRSEIPAVASQDTASSIDAVSVEATGTSDTVPDAPAVPPETDGSGSPEAPLPPPGAGTRDEPAYRVIPARRTWWQYAAAILIPVILGTVYVVFHHHSRSETRTIAAAPPPSPPDQYITLPDGSKVLLHKAARIDYPAVFSGHTREVYLRGEAFFDIKTGAAPFIVHTGNIKTTVLGTAFNINALEQHITVTVTKGKVRVENNKGDYSILKKDEQVTVDVLRNSIIREHVNTDTALAWKRPYLLFNDATMQEAADELQRRYNVSILFDNPALRQCNVTATFMGKESLEQIITILSKINNMEYRFDGPATIRLSGDGCN